MEGLDGYTACRDAEHALAYKLAVRRKAYEARWDALHASHKLLLRDCQSLDAKGGPAHWLKSWQTFLRLARSYGRAGNIECAIEQFKRLDAAEAKLVGLLFAIEHSPRPAQSLKKIIASTSPPELAAAVRSATSAAQGILNDASLASVPVASPKVVVPVAVKPPLPPHFSRNELSIIRALGDWHPTLRNQTELADRMTRKTVSAVLKKLVDKNLVVRAGERTGYGLTEDGLKLYRELYPIT